MRANAISKSAGDRLAGALLLGFLASFVAVIVVVSMIENDIERSAEWLATVARDEGRWAVMGIPFVLGSVLAVSVAGALYRALVDHDRLLAAWTALGFGAIGLLLAVLFVAGAVIGQLASELQGSPVLGADSLATTAWAFGRFITGIGIFLGSALFLALSLLALAALIVRNGVMPRPLGWMMLVAGALLALTLAVPLAGVFFLAGLAGWVLALLTLLITGILLLVSGTRVAEAVEVAGS